MNINQIKLFRDTYYKEAKKPNGKDGTLAEYVRLCLDGGIDFITSKDLVIFDDENELIHCICINEDARSQANFPLKTISAEYAIVQQIEAIMSKDNFNTFLSEGYIANVATEGQIDFIKKFAGNIRNQALQLDKFAPYKKDSTIAIAMPVADLKEIENVSVIGSNGEKRTYATAAEAILDIHDGDKISIYEDVDLPEGVVIDEGKDATINLNGHTITAAEGVTSLFKITSGNLTISGVGDIKSKLEIFHLDGTQSTVAPSLVLGPSVNVEAENDCVLYMKGVVNVDTRANIKSSGSYAPIMGNGNSGNGGMILNINGGIIESPDTAALYLPQCRYL